VSFGGFGGSTVGAGGAVNDPCGDGIQLTNGCDDGNTTSGDGCSATCEVEPGYICPIPGQPCRQPRCGDGHLDSAFVPGAAGEPTASGGSTSDQGLGGTAGFGAGGAPNGTFYTEQCDDGNTTSGDGCSATCEIEPGFVCTSPGQSCHEPRCGDGYKDSVFVPGAGGEPTASGGSTSDQGQGGVAGFGAGGAPPNGTFYSEQCDDGNTSSGDGCSSACEIETGYICSTPDQLCRKGTCGDGFVDVYVIGYGDTGTGGSTSSGGGGLPGAAGATAAGGGAGEGPIYYAESCDDGNAVSGDGCDSTCQIEPGYVCSAPDVACRKPRCGDGIVDFYYPSSGSGGSTSTGAGGAPPAGGFGGTTASGGTATVGVEQCDDGNNVSGDGCSATCMLE
jgi:cysteine-rich repeat protein